MAKRAYTLGRRAVSAEQTRERILDAAEALFWERDPDDITLDAIAARAGVTVQTVLRKLGSKDGVFAAAIEERAGRVVEQRKPASPDARSAVRALVASYEQMGDANWRVLRQEHTQPMLADVLAKARALHRGWVEESFSFALPAAAAPRARTIDALATVLDFYVWKLHRRDLHRSRERTEALMLDLVEAVLRGGSSR